MNRIRRHEKSLPFLHLDSKTDFWISLPRKSDGVRRTDEPDFRRVTRTLPSFDWF